VNPQNQITLDDPGVTVPSNDRWIQIADWTGPTQPMEVCTGMAYVTDAPGGTVQFPRPTMEAYTGLVYGGAGGNVWEPWCAGALRITYGASGARKTLICDIRAQSLYLGNCDAVRVEALRWRQTAWGSNAPSFIASANIGQARGGAYDEPTATIVKLWASGGVAGQGLPVPGGARWYTPFIEGVSDIGTAIWGGTNPAIFFYGAAQTAIVDGANYRWLPPLARFEVGFNSTWTFQMKILSAAALTSDLWIGARFYLTV
jgi:hypothetical protein